MKYISYYDVDSNKSDNRHFVLSARNKMDYILNVISEKNEIEIISASGVNGKKTAKGKKIRISDRISLILFTSIGRKNKWLSLLSNIYLKSQLFLYLLFNTVKDEKIIVYHSLGYCSLVRWIKKIKKFNLILEMEELYGDVTGKRKDKKKELKLARYADAFIFPTQMLNETVNPLCKPYVIIHGTYQIEPDRYCNVFKEKSEDISKTVHCVYAGTLDPRKGAIAAVKAAEYLPSNYHIHIIGFGNETEINYLRKVIDSVMANNRAKVSYDGLLSGEEYINFLQSCDIGLSPQDPTASFNATSFPSKILSYLSNGLSVVSIRIPAIEQSAIGKELYYFDVQTPQEIASAIMSVNLNAKYNGREIINHLNNDFKKEIFRLLGD